MKNLLNCHAFGLHSFPISQDQNGLYRRVFYAGQEHMLWRPYEVAIHPHHTDIRITVLEGVLFNHIYKLNSRGDSYGMYQWNSHILNGSGSFEYLGKRKVKQVSNVHIRAGESFSMKACELHTVFVSKGQTCVWLIEESAPSCEYVPVNYSPYNLAKWSPEGLYIEVGEATKMQYIGKYMEAIEKLHK